MVCAVQRSAMGFEASYRRHLANEQRRAVLEALATSFEPNATGGEIIDAAAATGWGAVGEQLSGLAARQRWAEMPGLITDAMLEEYAVIGRWADLPRLIEQRFGGLLDRVMYYLPFVPEQMDERWRQAVGGFHA